MISVTYSGEKPKAIASQARRSCLQTLTNTFRDEKFDLSEVRFLGSKKFPEDAENVPEIMVIVTLLGRDCYTKAKLNMMAGALTFMFDSIEKNRRSVIVEIRVIEKFSFSKGIYN